MDYKKIAENAVRMLLSYFEDNYTTPEKKQEIFSDIGLSTRKDFKEFGYPEMYDKINDPYYELNRRYNESGIRFYAGRKLIRCLTEDSYNDITRFTVEPNKNNESLIEEIEHGYGWCLVYEAIHKHPEARKFKFVEDKYIDESKIYGYETGTWIDERFEPVE